MSTKGETKGAGLRMGPGAYNISTVKDETTNMINIEPQPGFSKDVTFRINRRQETPGGLKTDLLVEIKPYTPPLPRPDVPTKPVFFTTEATQYNLADIPKPPAAKGKGKGKGKGKKGKKK